MNTQKAVHKLTIADERVNPEIYTSLDDSSDQYIPVTSSSGGLTKREYFAAMAMGGMFTNEMLVGPDEYLNIAKDAVVAADALIEALNKEQS